MNLKLLLMKKIIVLLLLFVPLLASAQRIDKPGEPYYFYCIFNNSGTYLDAKFPKDGKRVLYRVVCNKDGELIKGKPYEQSLTYLSKLGWEFVSFTEADMSEFLMRKKVVSDEEAKEGLYFEDEFKNK